MVENKEVDIAQLNYFKELHSGHKIVYVRFCNTDFVFRTLTRKEYKYILSINSDRMSIEDAICNTACIFPEEYDFSICGFAGLIPKVANFIETISGFNNIQVVLKEYHMAQEQNSLELQCMDLIKAFIPEYTYDEMEDWTWSKLIQTAARAEKVAKLKGFDWHLEDKSQEYFDKVSQINMDNAEFIDQLKQNGVDPMFYFADELKNIGKHEIVDFPLIGGVHWNNEVVLNAIREQIAKKKIARA